MRLQRSPSRGSAADRRPRREPGQGAPPEVGSTPDTRAVRGRGDTPRHGQRPHRQNHPRHPTPARLEPAPARAASEAEPAASLAPGTRRSRDDDDPSPPSGPRRPRRLPRGSSPVARPGARPPPRCRPRRDRGRRDGDPPGARLGGPPRVDLQPLRRARRHRSSGLASRGSGAPRRRGEVRPRRPPGPPRFPRSEGADRRRRPGARAGLATGRRRPPRRPPGPLRSAGQGRPLRGRPAPDAPGTDSGGSGLAPRTARTVGGDLVRSSGTTRADPGPARTAACQTPGRCAGRATASPGSPTRERRDHRG